MAGAAGRAENATDKLAIAARRANGAAGAMNVGLRQQAMVLGAARSGMGLTAAEGLNMSRQFADIGVTAAMGMNPLLIAIQQGPQLMDVFQQAAMRTGASVTAVMRGVAVAVWSAMAPLLPFIAAAAAAAAVIGGGLALATRELNKEAGDLTVGMGLTADQLEKVKNKGVTMGDVLVGTFNYVKDIIWDVLGPSITKIGEWFSEAMDKAARFSVQAIKVIVGGFLGSFRAIKAVWSTLPAVMGDLAVSAANAAIRAIEWMINKSVIGINLVIGVAKQLAVINPAFAAARGMSLLSPVDLAEMANANAGAARAAGATIAREFAGGMDSASGMVDRQLAALGASIRDAGRDRIMGEAGEADAARSSATGRGRADPAERQVMFRAERSSLRPLNAVVEMQEPLKVIADELRLIDTLARDAAGGMASAFGDAGRAMGELLTTMTGYQSRLAEINLAQKEGQISAMQADRERASAQVQSYGDMLGAAKGFFKEGSDGYKVLQTAEQAYRLMQFAMAVQAMVMDTQQTGVSVGNSMARGAASAAAGAAKMFEMLGPFAFPIVAGMLALLAGLGLRGSGGSSSKPGAAREQSVDTAREQVTASRAGGNAFAQSVAQKVEIRVTADRDGMHAYVVDTAAQTAAPLAMQAAAGAYSATRADNATAQRRSRQRFV